MSEKIDKITTNLKILGLSEEEIQIYLVVVQVRGDTALAISRATKLKRTTVYRILDSLITKKFLITRAGDRGLRFVATPSDQLDFLISDQEQKLNSLKKIIPTLQVDLSTLQASRDDKTKVLYYHGEDGLKQVTYNSLKAKGELLTYELSTMNAFMDQAEAEKLRQRFADNKIKIRTLTNAMAVEPYTEVTELVTKYWDIRHLDPKDKPFQFEILIYNDVYCMYRYTGGEVFCVEIHSHELADMQRQLFEYLWLLAKPFKILNDHGSAQAL